MSWNVSMVSVSTNGALNVGLAVLALDNVTVGPTICIHEYVNASLSGSELDEPSSVTDEPSLIVWSGPALAIGGLFDGAGAVSGPQSGSSSEAALFVSLVTPVPSAFMV